MHTTLKINRSNAATTGEIIQELALLEALGANLAPVADAVATIHALHARWLKVAAASRDDKASHRDLIAQAANAFAEDTGTIETLRTAAVAATLARDDASALYVVYQQAQAALDRRARTTLTEVGDKWITDIMRPAVEELGQQIMADIPAALVERIHPRDPDSEQLLAGRLTAQLAHGQLRQLHGLANRWRGTGIIPATPRDTSAWEWAETLGERGSTYDTLPSYVHQAHRDMGPGIYTEAQAQAAEDADPSRPVNASDVAAQLAATQRKF